jgi:hypothetical protein
MCKKRRFLLVAVEDFTEIEQKSWHMSRKLLGIGIAQFLRKLAISRLVS